MPGVAYDRPRRRAAAREAWRQRRRAGYLPRGRERAHARTRSGALALAYPVQAVSRARFAELYAATREREGRTGYDRGLESHYERYRALSRLYRVKGQGARTTNAQGVRALELAGRPRCRRTVQRLDAGLAAMGLVQRHHVRLGRDRPGFRDHLRIEVLSPRLRQQEHRAFGPRCAPAPARFARSDSARSARRADRVSVGCADREWAPPAAPVANGSDEGESTSESGEQLSLDELAADKSSSFSSSLASKWLAEADGNGQSYADLDERRARVAAGELVREYREQHEPKGAPP